MTIEKAFVGKKPQTKAALTAEGRSAFHTYRQQMAQVLKNLPD